MNIEIELELLEQCKRINLNAAMYYIRRTHEENLSSKQITKYIEIAHTLLHQIKHYEIQEKELWQTIKDQKSQKEN